MRNFLVGLLLFPLLTLLQTGDKPAPPPDRGDQTDAGVHQPPPEAVRAQLEQSIKQLLASQVESWNHGDLEGFMQGYWNSPDLEFFSGATVTKGWEPTLLRYRQRYQSEGKEMGKLEFQDLNIDPLSARAAVVTGKWQLTMSDGKQPHGVFTLILKKLDVGWRIVHDHSSGE